MFPISAAAIYKSGSVTVVNPASSVDCLRENKQSEANKQTWPGDRRISTEAGASLNCWFCQGNPWFATEILVEKSYFTFILIQATQLQPWGSALCCSEIISTLLISLKHSLCWGAHIQCSNVHSKTSKRTDPLPPPTPSYTQQQSEVSE